VRSREEVAFVIELVRAGWNDCEIARETGIPRRTILDWRSGRTPHFDRQSGACLVCLGAAQGLPLPAHTYLLGLYLGEPLVRGLLHFDGCRVLNWVNGTPYPRYHFSNVSADIRGIFGRACDQLGIEWRPNNRWSLSVARRGSVALLDEFVGPKR
jgi:hypothetical protein